MLSAAFEPVDRVGWQRAMTLFVSGRVEVVESYAERVVRTIDRAFQLPAVVRFHTGTRHQTRRLVRFSRENVWLRDSGCCQYCAEPVPLARITYDHVVPRSRGGRTGWDNVVIACRPCNQRKADRTPEEAGMWLSRAPVRPRNLPRWRHPDIRWREDMPAPWAPYLGAAFPT
ncbi:MAG: HNH endonuclease [Deltaproteobacteria bacterium]|nr:HNH endonuclease [Deltaproteobacteria bacterium]MCB9785296.1 HNH endonuclease [Deltaproteobacteria bacterium]